MPKPFAIICRFSPTEEVMSVKPVPLKLTIRSRNFRFGLSKSTLTDTWFKPTSSILTVPKDAPGWQGPPDGGLRTQSRTYWKDEARADPPRRANANTNVKCLYFMNSENLCPSWTSTRQSHTVPQR